VLPHAASMSSMRSAQCSLVIAVLIVFMPSVLCSPVCALSCAVNGCSVARGIEPLEGGGQQSDCQGHDLAPTSQNQKSPQGCSGHFGATAHTSSCLLSGQSLHSFLSIHSSSRLLLLEISQPSGASLVIASNSEQRSPPLRLLLRI
jgi:hypothetical protein